MENHDLRHLIYTRFSFSVQEYLHRVPRMILARGLLDQFNAIELDLQYIRAVSTADSGNLIMLKVSFSIRRCREQRSPYNAAPKRHHRPSEDQAVCPPRTN